MKLTDRDRTLLGVVVALVLCAAFYMLAIRPEHGKAAHLAKQIASANASLATAQRNETEGHAAEVALRRTRSDWGAAQHAVPKVANVPALLKLLQHSAEAARVSMQSISLSASGSSSGATAAGASTTDAGAVTIPVSLAFAGGYQALNRLLKKLDSLVTVSNGHLRAAGPLIGIGAVTVNPADSGSASSKLSVQLTATIYQHSAASTVLGNTTEGS